MEIVSQFNSALFSEPSVKKEVTNPPDMDHFLSHLFSFCRRPSNFQAIQQKHRFLYFLLNKFLLNKTLDWNDLLYVMSSVQSGIQKKLKKEKFSAKNLNIYSFCLHLFFICQNNDPENGFSFSFSLFLLFFIFFL